MLAPSTCTSSSKISPIRGQQGNQGGKTSERTKLSDELDELADTTWFVHHLI